MVVNGCLVVKLPRNRVDQLVVTAPASDSTMATDAR
jgi:hypothetical protein